MQKRDLKMSVKIDRKGNYFMNIMKKKSVMIAVAAAAVLVIGTAGCGSGTPSGGRGSKYEKNSGTESRYEGAAGEKDGKEQDGKEQEGEIAEEGRKDEQEKKKPVRSEGQEIVGITSEAKEGYSSELERLFAEGVGDIVCREELTWFGDYISTLNYETVMASLEKNGFRIEKDFYQEEEGRYYGEACYGDNGTHIDIFQKDEEDRLEYIDLIDSVSDPGPSYTTDIREIAMGDSMETVLEKLGFTNVGEIMAYITEKQQLVYSSYEECYDVSHTYLRLERADGSRTIISVSLYLPVEIDGKQYRIGREGENGAMYIGQYPQENEDGAVTLVFDTDNILRVLRLQ